MKKKNNNNKKQKKKKKQQQQQKTKTTTKENKQTKTNKNTFPYTQFNIGRQSTAPPSTITRPFTQAPPSNDTDIQRATSD